MKGALAILFGIAALAYAFVQVLLIVLHPLFVALSTHPQ